MNKLGKGGTAQILVRCDVTCTVNGTTEIVLREVTTVANVGRLHLYKGERDATGASFSLVDATTGYTFRSCTKARGLRFLRKHNPGDVATYFDVLTSKDRTPFGRAQSAEERAALDAVFALVQEFFS
jgi:hypothetical protein